MRLSDQLLDYDAWANREWERFFASCSHPPGGVQVFQHISECMENWRDRVPLKPHANENAYAFWERVSQEADLTDAIEWERMRTGKKHRNTVGDVLNHLITHGTYHRGHLRGLAELQGWGEFPETDFIRYAAKPKTPMLSGSHPAHLDLFAHDAWAWKHWQEVEMGSFGELSAKRKALAKHHAGCCRGWGGGTADLLGESDPDELSGGSYDLIDAWTAWWRETIEKYGFDYKLDYPGSNGNLRVNLGQIGVHVANHGSYHRGHLRAVAEHAGLQDWPDTDFILFSAKDA